MKDDLVQALKVQILTLSEITDNCPEGINAKVKSVGKACHTGDVMNELHSFSSRNSSDVALDTAPSGMAMLAAIRIIVLTSENK